MNEVDDDVQNALEDALNEEAPALAASAAPDLPRRRPGPGLRRKHRAKTSGVGAAPVIAPPLTPAQQVNNRDVALIWTRVVEEAAKNGAGPDSMYIRCKRWSTGPLKTLAEDLATIDGTIVGGSDTASPGEELIDYVTQVYHLGAPIGAAKYEFDFFNKSGKQNHLPAPKGELRLGDPKDIMRQREAAEVFARRKAYNAGSAAPTYSAFNYRGVPSNAVGSYPTPPNVSVHQPPQSPQYPPPVAGASPELEGMRRSLEAQAREQARLSGMYEERLRLEGLAPPPAAAAPTKEELSQLIATSVAQTLVGMGFKPPGIDTHPPATPPPSVQQVQTATKDPIDSMETLFTNFERMEKLKGRMKTFFSPEEEESEEPVKPSETPQQIVVQDDPYKMKEVPLVGDIVGVGKLQFGPRVDGESLVDYAIRLGVHNPTAAEKIMSGIVSRMDQGAIGQLMRSMIERKTGAPAQQPNVVEMPAPPQPPPPAPPRPNGMGGGWKPTP
jgi:hypothetical protein